MKNKSTEYTMKILTRTLVTFQTSDLTWDECLQDAIDNHKRMEEMKREEAIHAFTMRYDAGQEQ